jgi:hypothetical protein
MLPKYFKIIFRNIYSFSWESVAFIFFYLLILLSIFTSSLFSISVSLFITLISGISIFAITRKMILNNTNIKLLAIFKMVGADNKDQLIYLIIVICVKYLFLFLLALVIMDLDGHYFKLISPITPYYNYQYVVALIIIIIMSNIIYVQGLFHFINRKKSTYFWLNQ